MRKLYRSVVAGTVLAGAVLASGVAYGFPAFADSYQTSCLAALISHRGWVPSRQVQWRSGETEQVGDPGVVHASRWPGSAVLADLGDYTEMHWQVSPPRVGQHVPHAGDCTYQVVVRLRPQDARDLGRQIAAAFQRDDDGKPTVATGDYINEPQYVWPALRKFVPADPHWLHTLVYDERIFSNPGKGTRWRRVFLDVEHAVAVLEIPDSSD